MTKPGERERARALRREGKSIVEIAKEVGCSKSTISTWVRDIQLTPEQRAFLVERKKNTIGQMNGSKTNRLKGLEQRRQYQEDGRARAREGDPLHMMGCMLYWAEGRKHRNILSFSSADAQMMNHYMKFLRDALFVPDEMCKVRVFCYLNNGISQEDIEQYWLDLLGLSRMHLKSTIVNQSKSSHQKGRKLTYGVCNLNVYSTLYVQHVFGAIQEYVGFENDEWLF